MANITKADWTYDHAAYLLERAGFGHDGKIDRDGNARAVLRLVESPNRQPEDFVDRLFPKKPKKLAKSVKNDDDDVLAKWMKAMYKANGRRTVQEKMVLFLHMHFTTQRSVVSIPSRWDRQIALFRHHAVWDFRELAKAMNIDNAMLSYLDGESNEKGNINENHGRELLELYLLGSFDFAGQRNYAQRDVAEVARILSGWITDSSFSNPDYTGRFIAERHDDGTKTVFAPDLETPLMDPGNQFTVGDLGEQEHRFLIDRIFDHVDSEGRPTVARNLTRKLWAFFAWEPEVTVDTARADLALIDELADVFRTGTPGDGVPYQLHNVLRAMFLREEFYAHMGQGRAVKNPTEFVVSTARKLWAGARPSMVDRRGVSDDELFPTRSMGMELYEPPNVAGWPGNEEWISLGNFIERMEWAEFFTERDYRSDRPGLKVDRLVRKWFVGMDPTRAEVVDRVLRLMGPLQASGVARQALIDWLGPDDSVVDFDNDNFLRDRMRGLIMLVASMPQYHVF